METLQFRAWGSDITAIWDSPQIPLDEWVALPYQFEKWEQALSRFRPDSELMDLNRRAGQPMQVSDTMATLIEVAQWGAQWSGGLVVPTLLERLNAAGYTRSFETLGTTIWGNHSVSASLPLVSMFHYDPVRHVVTLPVGVQLDFGGVAKGWAADTVVRQWGTYSPVLMDVGGDIAVSGPRADGTPWPIAVADPRVNGGNATLALVMLTEGGVATSGRDYRRWTYNGRAMHHIIDPRTGEPATTNVLTATIVAPSALEAEIAAKVVLILGAEAGIAWIEAHAPLAALVVCDDGTVVTSSQWSRHCWQA